MLSLPALADTAATVVYLAIAATTSPSTPVPSSMNYPAASRGVSGTRRIPSEQTELLRMLLSVLLLPPLGGDLALDLAFASVTADRADVVPVRPELAAPEGLLHRGDAAEHLAGGQALDRAHDLRRAVRGDRLHEEVHVIPVRPDLQKRDLVPGCHLETDVTEHLVHVRRDHRTPVLRRTDDVVEQDGVVVAAVDVLTLTPSLSQPDAVSRRVSTRN